MLQNITSLSLAFNYLDNFDNLDAFKDFHNLEYLNMSHAHIHHLTVWDNFPRNIYTLDISGIGIEDIDFRLLSNENVLNTLVAKNNKLQNIVLNDRMTKLQTLILSNNKFKAFPQMPPGERLTSLKILDLSYNHIEILGPHALSCYPQLEIFRMSNNHLQTISDTAIPVVGQIMYELDLSFNLLTDMPLVVLPTLAILRLDSNRLRSVDPLLFRGLPTLARLDLSRNPYLFAVENCNRHDDYDCYPKWLNSVGNLNQLHSLNLARTGLVGLPETFISSLNALEEMDLSGNSLSASALAIWARTLALPPCLVRLNLSFNRLQSLGNASGYLASMRCLQEIDLSHNPYACDCRLAGMKLLSETRRRGRSLVRDIHNDSLYYCFTPKNHWQYPIFNFLTAVEPCERRDDFGLSLLKTIAALLLVIFAMIAVYMLFYKIITTFFTSNWRRQFQYFYKPLNTQPPDLNSPTAL